VSRRAYPTRAAARPQPTPRVLIASASWRAYRRSNSTRGWVRRKASRAGLAIALGVANDPAGCDRRVHSGRHCFRSEGRTSVFGYFHPGTAIGESEKRAHTRPGWRSLGRKRRHRAAGSGGRGERQAGLQKRVYGQKKRFSGGSSGEARRHQAGSTPGSPPEDHLSRWERRTPGRYEQPAANRAAQWHEPVGGNDSLPDGTEAFPRVNSRWTGPAWARCPGKTL
jgi:hypothetical protein